MSDERKQRKSNRADVAYIRLREGDEGENMAIGACYTKALLKSALQLGGCKPRIAHKASKLVFKALSTEYGSLESVNGDSSSITTGNAVLLRRKEFELRVDSALKSITDNSASQSDLRIAYSIREQRRCVVILMSGTSGTGKSTLASLLAAKMGITTVVSTDSIRHMLRSFTPETDDPVLWASTYQAGNLIPPSMLPHGATSKPDSSRYRTVKGYKVQCTPVTERVARLVANCEARNDSLVVEGVHLNIASVIRIMANHPCVVPFLVHISNEAKHRERFAVRAKYMTLDPESNRYIKHFRQIRTIQDYLGHRAARHGIPCVDNTNVDRSVAAIHATVLSFLRRQGKGEKILDAASKTTMPIVEDYEQCMKDAWSSKSMLQFIRSRKSATAANVTQSDSQGKSTTGTVPRSLVQSFHADSANLLSSDAVPLKIEEESSDGADREQGVEQRVEGGSVAETELEEQDDEHPSEGKSQHYAAAVL